MPASETGLLHIYYGDGKGKTTAAFGLALRCAGRGDQVVIAQFLKDGSSGECAGIAPLPGIQLLSHMPVPQFTCAMTPPQLEETGAACRALCQRAFLLAENVRLLVLDELLDVCALGMMEEDEVCRLLSGRGQGLEVVITGHSLEKTAQLAAKADYITRMCKEKHPYDRGLPARPGIEC